MFRYIAFVWATPDPGQAEITAFLSARLRLLAPDWQNVLNTQGLSVFCAGCRKGSSHCYPLADASGVVLGTFFRKANPSSTVEALSSAETESILESHGAELIRSYWGRYVAFLVDGTRGTKWVVKDPTGRLPCFRTTAGDFSVFFSCMSDFRQIAPRPLTLNWPFIRRRVAVAIGGAHETAINEVSQVCGGECVQVQNNEVTTALLWRPQEIAATNVIENSKAASEEMSETARACTLAWISGHQHVLHRLSGGLDSSIVLSCTRGSRAHCKVTCVTYHRPGGNSDERPWARLAANHAGCEHIEHPRTPCLDFTRLSRLRPQPSPPDDSAFLELTDFEHDLALEKQATAILSGDGGDAVLGSLSASFAAVDFCRRHGFDSTFFNIAMSVSLLVQTSVWSVFADALRRRYFGRERNDLAGLREARRLVPDDVFAAAAAERTSRRHPWFVAAEVPSSLTEILCFSDLADPFYDPLRPPEHPGAEFIAPLLSQPFVELCLRIPSYLHFEGGRDRGLARRAFSGSVPAEILSRHWKDRVQGFTEEILFHGRPFAREMLLDGVLVKERLLDSRSVELALSGLRAKSDVYVGEILDHVMTEAWLRAWLGSRPSRPTTAV